MDVVRDSRKFLGTHMCDKSNYQQSLARFRVARSLSCRLAELLVCTMLVCRQHSSGNQMNPSELTVCAGDITAFTKVIHLLLFFFCLTSLLSGLLKVRLVSAVARCPS